MDFRDYRQEVYKDKYVTRLDLIEQCWNYQEDRLISETTKLNNKIISYQEKLKELHEVLDDFTSNVSLTNKAFEYNKKHRR